MLNGLRAYFPDITAATKGSHQDALQADGRGMLLKYVSSYVPRFSDDFANEWLDDEGGNRSGYHVASKVLCDYHPQKPEMWLQLAAQNFPVFKMGGSIFPILAPYCGMQQKPDFVEQYETCDWRGDDMSLLEWMRKANKDGKPMRYIVGSIQARAQADEEGCARRGKACRVCSRLQDMW